LFNFVRKARRNEESPFVPLRLYRRGTVLGSFLRTATKPFAVRKVCGAPDLPVKRGALFGAIRLLHPTARHRAYEDKVQHAAAGHLPAYLAAGSGFLPVRDEGATRMNLPLLDRVTVASPCTARWEDMTGDERTRHCAQCSLRVHNLSLMTTDEAEALLQSKGDGRLCVRFYRRADGTVLTQDCPVGLAAARARVRRIAGRIAAALGLVTGGAALAIDTSREDGPAPVRLRGLRPFAIIAEWLVPTPPPMPPAVMPTLRTVGITQGAVAFIPPSSQKPVAPPPLPPGAPTAIPFNRPGK
jgi:hypothetical protein